MFCRYCGTQNKSTAQFCKKCGKHIKRYFKECSVCHEHVDEQVKICPYCFDNISLKESKKKTSSQKYGGFWIRLGAFIVDYFIISFIAFLVIFLFILLGFMQVVFWVGLVQVIIFVFYFFIFTSTLSSTPGKLLYGLKIISAHTGDKISWKQAVGRVASYALSAIPFLLGFFWIAGDTKKHRGWHDRIASTLVVRKKKNLVFPVIFSIIAVIIFFLLSLINPTSEINFDHLGEDSAVIYKGLDRIEHQPASLCCPLGTPSDIKILTEEIPIAPEAQIKTPVQIYEKFDKAVGLVVTDHGGLGSGVNITPSGLIITNQHVIEDAEKIVIVFTTKGELKAFDVSMIVAKSTEKDIAVLKIDARSLPYVPLGSSIDISPGEKVYAIGNPAGYRNTISDGIISQKRSFQGVSYLQITSPISSGSSGGPVVNEKGQVIGIVTKFHTLAQNLNFAVSVEELKKLLY